MSRLTKYRSDIESYDYAELCGGISEAICNKLGKFEDIEDELGCPLEVVFKALDSFYCPNLENDKRILNYFVSAFNKDCLYVTIIYSTYDDYLNDEITINLKDYGKTWWLKKDMSE